MLKKEDIDPYWIHINQKIERSNRDWFRQTQRRIKIQKIKEKL